MALELPAEHAEALNALLHLDADSFARLRSLLNEEPSTAEPERVAERIVGRIKEASFAHHDELMESVVQMLNTKRKHGMSDDEIVKAVLDGLDDKETHLSPEERDAASERLKSLIEPKSPLVRSLKAYEVLTSHQCVYREARIMTDVRPVFEDDLSEPFSEFVTIHTLQLSYWEDGRRKQFSVALDAADLRNLRATIDRAERKNEAVEARLKGLDLHIATPEHP